MKKIMIALAACSFYAITATAQVKMPQPSTTQTIKQEFGMGSIDLTYSRPNIKGRKIFGDLVPYGKLWRTGANAATKITFTDNVEIGGKKLDTGSYVLYTIPNKDSWEIVINKGLTNWGIDGYKESEDIVRFFVAPMKMKNKIESFTMQLADIKPNMCELHIMWDKTAVSIPIKTEINDKLRAQIEKALQGDKKPYWQAAQFYNEYDNNKAKALEMCDGALKTNDKAFWVWLYKAKLQNDLGDKSGALASSQKSMELAKDAKNDDYVKMNEELQKKLK
jgi:Protein of unknown function (DUF2911)